MNRHFVNYAALPFAPLGEPIRREAEKPSPETPWKPTPGHPDYRERINAQGVREVTHKDNMPAPAATALDPGRVMPEDVHGSCLKPAPVDPLDDLAERVANDSGMYRRLIEHRGGCRCCVSPPCNACVEPLTAAEAEALGWLDEEAAAPPVVKRVAKPAAAEVPEGGDAFGRANMAWDTREIALGKEVSWRPLDLDRRRATWGADDGELYGEPDIDSYLNRFFVPLEPQQ